jgi:two-component sensor histidine kinase
VAKDAPEAHYGSQPFRPPLTPVPERIIFRRFATALASSMILLFAMLGLGAWWTYYLAQDEARTVAKGMTRLVVSQVERLLDASDLMLEQMADVAAATDWAAAGARAQVDERLDRLRGALPISFRLFVWAPDGSLRATSVQDASPALSVSERDYFRVQVEADAGLYVSEPLQSKIDGTPIVIFSRGVTAPDGGFLGVVSFSVDSREIAQLYNSLGLPERWVFAWIHEARRSLLFREPALPQDVPLDKAIPSTVAARIALSEPEGWISYRSEVDGEQRTAFFATLAKYPISVFVGMSEAAVRDQWLKRSVAYFFTGLVAVAAFGVAGFFALRWARAEDERRTVLAGANAELERRVRERTAELTDLLAERDALIRHKDTLIQEVNHRVKNSLQQVAAMLTLQAMDLPPGQTREAIDDACARVNAVGTVHARLYESDFTGVVEAQAYLRELCNYFQVAAGPACSITLTGEPVELPLARAAPLALALNELLTNAIKHACRPGNACQVRVSLAATGEGMLQLTVENDGTGPAAGSDPLKTRSLGMRLIQTFARQLGGEFAIMTGTAGTRAEMTFPREAA